MVASIIAYKTVDGAVEVANILEVGLGALVWGNDTATAAEVAKRLQAGTRWVNRHAVRNPIVPMGGVKQSGIGVEFSEEGLREHTTVQVLSIAKQGYHMTKLTKGEVIAKSLTAIRVDTVFGILGAHMYDFNDALAREDGTRFIHTRHEQGAVYMAYGYARSSG